MSLKNYMICFGLCKLLDSLIFGAYSEISMILSTHFRGLAFHASSFWELEKSV